VEICFESVLLKFKGGSAEGVGLDNVGACAYIFGVHVSNEFGIAEIQFVIAAIDVHAFRVEHCSHCSVKDVNPVCFE
jgi:hypothetical protein